MNRTFHERMRQGLSHFSGRDMIDVALRAMPGRVALVSSFGTESAVLLHLAAQLDKAMPVVFLDTEKLFQPTLDYQKKLTAHLGLTNVHAIRPEQAEVQRDDKDGTLWQENPDRCCKIRKAWPLAKALSGFDAWITGRKSFQNDDRKRVRPAEIQDDRLVLSPLLSWSKADLDDYFDDYALPRHPLEEMGYLSVGCTTCTSPVRDGEDARSGRWSGQAKTECGIHMPTCSAAV